MKTPMDHRRLGAEPLAGEFIVSPCKGMINAVLLRALGNSPWDREILIVDQDWNLDFRRRVTVAAGGARELCRGD
jgi:hypothetical protein